MNKNLMEGNSCPLCGGLLESQEITKGGEIVLACSECDEIVRRGE